MSSQSLRGPVLGSLRSSTIGSGEWLPNITALRRSFLAGPFTDRARASNLHQQMNFLTLPSLGLEIQIHGSEPLGRRAKDWRSSSPIVEPYWSWMAWSRSNIHLVHKRDGYVSLPSRRFCVSLQPSIGGFASSLPGCRSLILPITSALRPCAVTWNIYPAMPVRSCSERLALKGLRRSCNVPATNSADIVSR